MFWATALLLGLLVTLGVWSSGWLRRRPDLPLGRVLLGLTGGVLLLALGLGAMWEAMPRLRPAIEALFLGGGTLSVLQLLREAPAVGALSRAWRWGLYTLGAALPALSLYLALTLLAARQQAEWAGDLLFWLTAAGLLLGLNSLSLLFRGWILPGPDERPTEGR